MSALRLRSVRFKDGYTADGLTNALSGLGGRNDQRMGLGYTATVLTQYDIDTAYRGSGMTRRVINLPALDMVREWRNWQAEAGQIKLLEAEEKRLDLRAKVRLAEVMRGLGGGAFILGVPGDPASPAPKIAKGGLSFIHVVSRWQITLGPIVENHEDPAFGGPQWFDLQSTSGQMRFHPSRVVCFRGDAVPCILTTGWDEQFWGESRIAAILDAVKNSDSSQAHFAALIGKVRNTIIGIPGLLDLVETTEGEALLQKRIMAMVLGEGMFNATLRDAGDGTAGAGETIDNRQINWAGIPEIMMAFATFIAALAGMPATLLLGKSPDGQNATGKSDQDNWNRQVKARQTLELGPCIDRVDEALVPSALGSKPDDVWYEWAPLDTPSEKEIAETFDKTMDAVTKLQATNTVPDEAMSRGVQNLLTEAGWIPGLEGALALIPEDLRFGLNQEPDPNAVDPSALTQPGDPKAGAKAPPMRRAANDARFLSDAAPRTLYIERKLLNADEVIRWAKSQGLETTLAAADMHVTIAFSRAPVDWFAIGSDWSGDEEGKLRVKPGGPRAVERLGDGDAVALLFVNDDLEWRHKRIIEAGASWDWPEYRPHITLSWKAEGVDAATIKPYAGPLVFGPELFSEVVED